MGCAVTRYVHFEIDTEAGVLLQVMAVMEEAMQTGDPGLDQALKNFYNAMRAELQHVEADVRAAQATNHRERMLASLME